MSRLGYVCLGLLGLLAACVVLLLIARFRRKKLLRQLDAYRLAKTLLDGEGMLLAGEKIRPREEDPADVKYLMFLLEPEPPQRLEERIGQRHTGERPENLDALLRQTARTMARVCGKTRHVCLALAGGVTGLVEITGWQTDPTAAGQQADALRQKLAAKLSGADVMFSLESGGQLKRQYDGTKNRRELAIFLGQEGPAYAELPSDSNALRAVPTAQPVDRNRQLFLRLINLDFDGGRRLLEEMTGSAAQADRFDIGRLKTLLATSLELAGYVLSYRQSRGEAVMELSPSFSGDMDVARTAQEVQQLCRDYIGLLEQEFLARDRKTEELTAQLDAYLKGNYQDANLGVASVAEHFQMSDSALSRTFKQATGENLSDYIQRLRVDAAIRLLQETELSLEQIGCQCGFGSEKTFVRSFKKLEGVTPAVYRTARASETGETE